MDVSLYEKELENRLRRMGYDGGCMDYVKVGFDDNKVIYRRMPNVDDFGGISEYVLNIYKRDLLNVLDSLNRDREEGVFIE